MNYQEFKDYIITHLWKQGDTVVINALDTIIKTAEAELNRDFKVEDRQKLATLNFPYAPYAGSTPHRCPLPADYREMRALYDFNEGGQYKYVTPSIYGDEQANGFTYERQYTVHWFEDGPVVSILNDPGTLANPLKVSCWYYSNIPAFASLPVGIEDSWMADRYLDVYLYTVLKHSAPFLREDERIQVWGALQSSAIVSAMTENLDRKYAGGPLRMKFSRRVR